MQKKIAFCFPGQGCQSLGMLKDIADEHHVIADTYSEASEVLGYDLWDICMNDQSKLDSTEYTQPAILAASVSMWRLWEIHNPNSQPVLLAGHSLGEYSALVCASSIGFQEAVQLVSIRGKLMQHAFPSGVGAMAAIIGLEMHDIADICDQARRLGEFLAIANYNSIGQVVLAGHVESLKAAVLLAKQRNAKVAKMLPVSIPSHCSMMDAVADEFRSILLKVQIASPAIPVIQNYNICYYSDPNEIREALIKQLSHPVNWVEIVRYMLNFGVEAIIECGPGKVLAGLNKRITTAVPLYALAIDWRNLYGRF